ncbi:MAG: hypothetical protein LUE13_01295 [Akkermansiaceae bacterium]|nr:hypothetical protein [Akkermansiaceae bacterium]
MSRVLSYPVRRPILFVSFFFVVLHLLYNPFFKDADNVYVFSGFYFDTEASPHCMYGSYFLTYPLYWLHHLSDRICWYTAYMFLINYFSACALFNVLTYESRRTGKYNFQALLGYVVLAQVLFHHTLQIHYGFYSFIAMGAGVLLVYAGCEHSIRKWVWSGYMLMLGGAFIRYDACIGMIPIIAALLLIVLLNRNTFPRYKKFLFLGISMIFVLLGIFSIQQRLAVDTWRPDGNFIEENNIRVLLFDYPDRSGLDKKALYADVGATEDDLVFITQGISAQPKKYSLNFLRNVAGVRKFDNPAYAVSFSSDYWRKMFITRFGMTLLIFGLFSFTRRSAINKLILLAFVFSALTVVYFKGRLIPSSQGAMCYGALAMLAYFTATPERGYLRKFLQHWGASIGLLAFLAIGGMYLTVHRNLFAPFTVASPVYRCLSAHDLLFEELQQNSGQIYFTDPHVWKDLVLPNHIILNPKEYFRHSVYPVYSWATFLPSYRNRLAKMHAGNDVLSMLEPRVRIIDDGSLKWYMSLTEEYLRKEYNISAKWTREKTLEGVVTVYGTCHVFRLRRMD